MYSKCHQNNLQQAIAPQPAAPVVIAPAVVKIQIHYYKISNHWNFLETISRQYVC
jgi:hypothetical protein